MHGRFLSRHFLCNGPTHGSIYSILGYFETGRKVVTEERGIQFSDTHRSRPWGAAQARVPTIIEKYFCFLQLLPPFPPTILVPPYIFGKSTPVAITNMGLGQ